MTAISYQRHPVNINATAVALEEYARGTDIPGDKVWLTLVTCEKEVRLETRHTSDMVVCQKVQAFFGADIYGFNEVITFLRDAEVEKYFFLRNRKAEYKLNGSITRYNAHCTHESSKIVERVARVIKNQLSPTVPLPGEAADDGIPEQFKLFIEEARQFVLSGDEWGPIDEETDEIKILNYIKGVLANPDFQNDPYGFMLDWVVKRGGDLRFQSVEDSAREFFNEEICRRLKIIGALVEFRPSSYVPDENIDEQIPDQSKQLYKLASEFIEKMSKEGGFATRKDEEAAKAEALAQIKEVVTNPDFQEDPIKFIEEWKAKRGSALGLKPADDTAALFFSTNSGVQSLSSLSQISK